MSDHDTSRTRTPVTLRPRDATTNSFIASNDRIFTMANDLPDLMASLQEEVWVIDEMMEELNWRSSQVLQPRTLPHGRLSAEGFRLLAKITEANDPAVATEYLVHETRNLNRQSFLLLLSDMGMGLATTEHGGAAHHHIRSRNVASFSDTPGFWVGRHRLRTAIANAASRQHWNQSGHWLTTEPEAEPPTRH
jgi:hypothetical protein